MSNDTHSEAAVATQIASAEQLGAVREARGWSVSDVASKLGMMPRQIEAIEQGRWEALPGHAFVRGAIRAYGKALQVDVAPLLTSLGSLAKAPELRPSASLEAPLPRHGALGFDNGGSGSRLTWILLGLLGVVAIALYFGRGTDFSRVLDRGAAQPERAVDTVPVTPLAPGGTKPGTAPAPAAGAAGGDPVPRGAGASRGGAPSGSSSSSLPSPGGAQTGDGRSDVAVSAAGASTGTPAMSSAAIPSLAAPASAVSPSALSSSATSPSAASPPIASTSPAAPSLPAAPGSASAVPSSSAPGTAASASGAAPGAGDAPADALVFRFERDSWVEVRDASGRVLLVGTQPARSTRQIAGRKPYAITVGNASWVRLEYAGKNVDLGAVTQKGVARVRID